MDSGRLIGSEIHGFHTLKDLEVPNIMKEATTRWLRPNEIHAILCNHRYFTIKVKPINLPQSGSIILFDRKMLRNFRKDGHNWKKKKDGKTVKEAHEHLKVGNEERIHVYYAHGQDNPTFVRRCYWLLDKSLENIVLVHYRQTQELQGSPATPLNSNPSTVSDPSTHWILPEELDAGVGDAYNSDLGSGDSLSIRNYEQRIHEINTLDWDELVASDPNELTTLREDKVASFDHHIQASLSGSEINGSPFSSDNDSAVLSSFGNLSEALCQSSNVNINYTNNVCLQKIGNPVNTEVQSIESIGSLADSFDIVASDGLRSQDSFGRWMNSIIVDSPSPVDNSILESSNPSGQASFSSAVVDDQRAFSPGIIFEVTNISPAWAFSTEETKILISGYFKEEYLHLAKSDLFCVCGDACIRTEFVQVGVYRCLVSPHAPGMVNLFISTDGNRPISQVLNFEYRAPISHDPVIPLPDYKPLNEAFQGQMRLAHLLFSTSKCIDIASNKVSPTALKEAKKFAYKASLDVSNNWSYIMNSFVGNKASDPQAKDVLFELMLKNRLIEWLIERIIEGYKTTEHDSQGQGVIHLCAILGYTWAVRLFSWSGLSLDFRDKHGWTALHWAAYCGKDKMVAALLSAGAKTYLVTDPTSENPGGCTAGDLASKQGYDGLGAYLAENSLVEHLKQIVISGNANESLQSTTETEKEHPENLSEDELCLKDTLAAYRTAADAAARIQAAFREHSFNLRSKVVESYNPEIEARNIIAAMKIQHAFRNYDSRKKMAAAARIQHRFRSWKMRQEFLAMRRHAIRIQASFRGFQVRRQYRKIIWSVGVLEKAILRWRLRRKGFRGLKVDPLKEDTAEKPQSHTEEDFFRASRKQAEERVERSVVRVQAMFRSKKAQEEYRKIKLAHAQAKLEYGESLSPNEDMDI